MIDVKILRENPEFVRNAIAKKKFSCDLDAFLVLDAKRREQVAEAENARAEQKAFNDKMAALKKGSPEFLEAVQGMKVIAARVKELEAAAKEVDEAWKAAFMTIPNMPHESVPIGKTEGDNQTVATWGDVNSVSPHATAHYDIPWFNQYIDFQRGVKVTGGGFPFYIGDMARLLRALISFYLDEANKGGYIEFLPPILINAASATATGQLPDKEGQMYHAQGDDLYLVPTAEVPVTNFFRDEIVEEGELPLKRCAYTPCFRREAGSWGKDVRGLNRLHQFDKVELVKWVHPEKSFEELESLRADAERLLQLLEIPYRVLAICTGDIGFPHSKQYDLEVWAGGQKRWLEVSSCSNFTDFQARRAGIRFRPQGGGKAQVVHTLNASGLAVPRVLAAILENNIQEDGRVKVPEVLKPWLGKDYIGESKVCESC
ncbi:MAG: serine--tRNA ligase [Verrucomicrobia bacterium CG_4_10_14_0_8_um_filter_43_34]|nr:MAG: serine--tRNA ligase [Verrucomicrobia bacterium CG_4_10_14_0_8_um_filter_43_34]